MSQSSDNGDDGGLQRGRHETREERLDRNWSEVLQELRVTQTGVQLLSGFLLTLPFQQRFEAIEARDRAAYLIVFALAALSTALLVAPASAHRLLFRRREKDLLVDFANVCALAGLATFALAVSLVVFLIVDVVVGLSAAIAAGGMTALVFLVGWVLVPVRLLRQQRAKA